MRKRNIVTNLDCEEREEREKSVGIVVSLSHTRVMYVALYFTSKGSFRSRKKIVKVSFPGVVVWGSCSVG